MDVRVDGTMAAVTVGMKVEIKAVIVVEEDDLWGGNNLQGVVEVRDPREVTLRVAFLSYLAPVLGLFPPEWGLPSHFQTRRLHPY